MKIYKENLKYRVTTAEFEISKAWQHFLDYVGDRLSRPL
jgi:hypothetical protein